MTKPTSYEGYLKWAKENLDSDFEDPRVRRVYDANLLTFYNLFSRHNFYLDLQDRLTYWEQIYQDETEARLFMEHSPPEILRKPFKSAVDKSFRVNVLWNDSFPEPPKHGWVNAENLCYYFNDVIRTSIVCRFIDGPMFVTDQLMTLAKELDLERRRYTQEREEGYYAYHFYVKFPVNVVGFDWEQTMATLEVEIQVTTQLQDVLRDLTHSFYRESRLSSKKDSKKWKWSFRSNQFRIGYLSHALHLLESIILDAREGVIAENKSQEVPDDQKK